MVETHNSTPEAQRPKTPDYKFPGRIEQKADKTISFSLQDLGSPDLPSFIKRDGQSEFSLNSIDLTVKEFVVDHRGGRFALEVAEYVPPKPETEEDDRPGITLVITGGGTSGAVGSNIKLGLELQQSLLDYQKPKKYGSKDTSSTKTPRIKRVIVLPNIIGVAREKNHDVTRTDDREQPNLQQSGEIAAAVLLKLGLPDRVVAMGFSAGGAQSIEMTAFLEHLREGKNNANDSTTTIHTRSRSSTPRYHRHNRNLEHQARTQLHGW